MTNRVGDLRTLPLDGTAQQTLTSFDTAHIFNFAWTSIASISHSGAAARRPHPRVSLTNAPIALLIETAPSAAQPAGLPARWISGANATKDITK